MTSYAQSDSAGASPSMNGPASLSAAADLVVSPERRQRNMVVCMDSLTDALLSTREEGDQLARRDFEREAAERLDLSDLTFQQVRFARCQFTNCDFSGAAFFGCAFEDCAFSGCRFAVSFWRDAALSGCKAEGGDFRKARFKGCALDRLRLRWANLTGALWERCALTDCDLTESGCQELRVVKTTLQAVNFTQADLFRAVLKGTDLSGCILDGVTLSASCQELRGAKIHAAQAAVVARILGIEIAD